MAGVINIISDKPTANKASLQLHRATNNTLGVSAVKNFTGNKISLQLFGNRYSSSGYDLDKNIYGKTADPFRNYSCAAKAFFNFNTQTQLQSSVRLFTQQQFNKYLVYTGNQPGAVEGRGNETDWSFNNQLHLNFSDRVKLVSRLFVTGYQNNADVFLQKDNTLFDHSFLHQFLLKPEIQLELGHKNNEKFITGIGYNYETIDANRYAAKKKFIAVYGYAQKEWLPFNSLNITLGARLNKHSLYKAQSNKEKKSMPIIFVAFFFMAILFWGIKDDGSKNTPVFTLIKP